MGTNKADYTREPLGTSSQVALAAVGGFFVLIGAGLWSGGQLASLLSGNGFAAGGNALSGVSALVRAGSPERAWHSPMPGPLLYWLITAVAVAVVVGGPITVWLWIRGRRNRDQSQRVKELAARPGMAEPHRIDETMGTGALAKRAESLRPSVYAAGEREPHHYGWCWGHAADRPVWTSVRDAAVILGPAGSGKTVYVVIPRILDAPGALIVTSTRPDVLTPTYEVRQRIGPVAVLAADGSVAGLPSVMAWSPIRGCEDGETAQVRAKVLAAGTSTGVENGSFWEGQTESILKALLHAAALSNARLDEFWRWSLSPDQARPAVQALTDNERAEQAWAEGLAAVIDGDDKFRQNAWSGVRMAMAGLDVGAVRRRFDPEPGQEFDVIRFLRNKGTLYLLARDNDPAARFLSAMIADITRVARQLADASPGSRLDPPLTLMLDEIANFSPLPDLPVYLSAYGGSGIVTFAVFQDLAQVQEKWGAELAAAMWGAATIKVVLGGVTSADTLRDLMLLTGERDEETWSMSSSGIAQSSVSSNVRLRPVLDGGEIRTLPEGVALMLFKGNRPALVTMTPYYRRAEAASLAADRTKWETIISEQAAARLALPASANQG